MTAGLVVHGATEATACFGKRALRSRAKTASTIAWAIAMLLGTESALRVRAWYRHGSQSPVADIYEASDSLSRRLRPGAILEGHERQLSINRLGFRGPEIPVPKPDGTIRIAALGDSTTFGMEAGNDASVWVERMVAELNASSTGLHFDAINGGVPGFTIADSIRLFDQRIAKLGPDVVVVDQAATDIAAHARRQFGDSARTAAPAASLARFFQEHSLLINLLRQNTVALAARLIPQRRHDRLDSGGMEKFSARLAELLDSCRRNGLTVILCTAPRSFGDSSAASDQFALAASALAHNPALSLAGLNDAFDRYNDAIRRFARSNGVPVVDLDDLVPKRADYFVDAVHLNDAGHALVGKLVAERIRTALADLKIARSAR